MLHSMGIKFSFFLLSSFFWKARRLGSWWAEWPEGESASLSYFPTCEFKYCRLLLQVNDRPGSVLVRHRQFGAAAGEGQGNFGEGFLGRVVDFTQVGQDDVLQVFML